MPRKPREEYEAGIYHVFARGNAKADIFRGERDRARYLGYLAAAVGKRGWHCMGYCLMANHVHLLIETVQPNLGDGIRQMHGGYAQWFNQRHDRVGHLFQGRFGSKTVADDSQLLTVGRYIARNPVKAGLCDRPEDYRWSSFSAYVGGSAPAWLALSRFEELLSGWGSNSLARFAELSAQR